LQGTRAKAEQRFAAALKQGERAATDIAEAVGACPCSRLPPALCLPLPLNLLRA
jgi:hypothetical protein